MGGLRLFKFFSAVCHWGDLDVDLSLITFVGGSFIFEIIMLNRETYCGVVRTEWKILIYTKPCLEATPTP